MPQPAPGLRAEHSEIPAAERGYDGVGAASVSGLMFDSGLNWRSICSEVGARDVGDAVQR